MKTMLQILTIVVLLIIIFVLGALLYWKMLDHGDKSGSSTTNVTSKSVSLVPEIKNTITVKGNQILIQGTTNLPDGTNVKYNLWHLDKLSIKNNIEKVVSVQNKTLYCEVLLDGTISPQEMTLNSEVFFNKDNQPDNVKQILGDKGQK